MKLNIKELEAIKELIYIEIDKRNGFDNIDPDLKTTLSKILEELGVMDLAEAYITSQVISPEMMMGMAKVFDGTQADFGFDDHTPPQETFEESATTDNKAGLDNVMRMVKNNPELLAAYKKGKPAAIKALKSMKSTA